MGKLGPIRQRTHDEPRRPSKKSKNKRAKKPGKGEDLGPDRTLVFPIPDSRSLRGARGC